MLSYIVYKNLKTDVMTPFYTIGLCYQVCELHEMHPLILILEDTMCDMAGQGLIWSLVLEVFHNPSLIKGYELYTPELVTMGSELVCIIPYYFVFKFHLVIKKSKPLNRTSHGVLYLQPKGQNCSQ